MGGAAYQAQPAGIDLPEAVVHDTDAHDDGEADEDEEEVVQPEPMAPELLSEAMVRSGFLLKRGDKRKHWKKRWVVLRASRLAFYKNQKEYRLMKVVNTHEIRAAVPVDFKRVGLTVGIVTPERTLYIRGATQEETYAWLHDINRIREQSRDSQPGHELAHHMHALHMRNDGRPLSPRLDSGPAAYLRVEQGTAQAPITIAPRSVTAPTVSISQVCDDMRAEPVVLSTSPSSMTAAQRPLGGRDEPQNGDVSSPHLCTAPPIAEALEHDDAHDTRLMPPAMQPVLSSSEEEGEQDETRAPPAPLRLPSRDEDVDRIVAQGYLMKQSSRRKQWRKRWFVLTVHNIFYAGSHMDSRAHRSIPTSMILDVMECEPPASVNPSFSLRSLSSAALPTDTPHGKHAAHAESPIQSVFGPSKPRMDHCFKIVTPMRTYFLCAPTEEDEIKWLSALQTILNRQRSAPGSQQRTVMSPH
ncbi:hypothetical protein MBRA1_000222 [Malassezia brasiliensis]|uniref:PH domain-containing protein n=1 Tax=Malassezia brasiliensis TaxID=1821822 RepID=A0AAF0IND1_9BASI|nr:hypothetical protein MBRA1_000222 [Malassezia brasiliensis]